MKETKDKTTTQTMQSGQLVGDIAHIWERHYRVYNHQAETAECVCSQYTYNPILNT